MRGLMAVLILASLTVSTVAAVRVKQVARVQGVRDNQLVGYGLVVGLNRTGDRQQTFFTTQSLINMLDRLGVTVTAQSLRVENIAAVMVTAELPSFARAGSRLDCTND